MSETESWGAYASDAEEALGEIEQALLSLEATTDMAVINRLYRALHTIKGNSGFLHLRSIERVAHAAESIIGLVRDQGRAIEEAMIELLFHLVDLLRRLINASAIARADVYDPEIEPLVTLANGFTGVLLPEARDEGLHLFDEEPTDDIELGLDAFFRALAMSAWESIVAGDDVEQALTDLHRGASRTGRQQLANAAARCLESLPPSQGSVAQLGLALQHSGIAVSDFTPAPLPTAPTALAAPTPTAPLAAPAPAPRLTPVAAVEPTPTDVVAKAKSKAPTVTATSAPREDTTLRIDGSKATTLMALTGELGLAVHAVTRHPGVRADVIEGFQAAAHRLENLVTELQNEASGLRLVPVSSVFTRMRRVVRDTCLRTGKEADLVIVGEDTEIDKAFVDRLHDPLVHVLRNAIDHGLETPEERERCGKPRRGRVVLQAAHRGGVVEIVVGDDGAGVNIARVKARAIERGLCTADAALSDADVIEFLFSPGFSTAAQVTELSGRGVGLDVMRSTIESMRGSVRIRSIAGVGMRMEITLPLTVAFLEAMVVRAHGWLLAVPIEKVHHVERLPDERVVSDPGSSTVLARLDDGLVPIVKLSRFFNAEIDDDKRGSTSGQLIVVVNSQRGRIAFPVEKLVGNQQVMLKPMNGLLQNIRASSGYGVLRSGEVALTLDCERLHAG